MDSLRQVYESLGLRKVRSYLQSGNLLFESEEPDRSVLVRSIEAGIQAACGYRVPVFLRQADELRVLLDGNPFLAGRNEDRSRLYVTFLYQPPDGAAWGRLQAPAATLDEFMPGDSAIYLFCPQGYGKTKLSNSFFERKLGMPLTTRNWNTVEAVWKMLSE
jgi:uncharacterized protein (DUF1697 family)